MPIFEFDRYINGTLMAEGVTIEREPDLTSAMRAAVRRAARGPRGEVPVLVLRQSKTPLMDDPTGPRASATEALDASYAAARADTSKFRRGPPCQE